MKTRYMTILTTLAFLGLSISALAAKPVCPGDPRCKPDDGGAITYTAELTGAFFDGAFTVGAFEFNTMTGGKSIVVVTPNKRKSSLHSNEPLDMVRPGLDLNADPPIETCSDVAAEDVETYEACQVWNHVFNTCPLLLVENSVQGFFVGADDWSIQKPGGGYVQFNDMLMQNAEVTVALYGDKAVNTDPFLPKPDPGSGNTATSVFILDRFATWGKSLPGAEGSIMGCDAFVKRPLGYDNGTTFIEIPSTLLITATRE